MNCMEGAERICPLCGKKFTVLAAAQYAYRRTRKGRPVYLCSYGCSTKFDEAKRNGKKQ
ncbi:MAG: hypothetical protein J6P40_02210 [Oscillospiraceae bacterium]|nr:hypothetical protein [Oscillospiraceae bacterium]